MSRKFYTAALAVSMFAFTAMPSAFGVANAQGAQGQEQPQQYGALERGWRTGYSDGYQSGWADSAERRASDYRGKDDYKRADRAYAPSFGPLEDYRDGYRQGFESGYGDGYARRGFSADIPSGGIQRRGAPALEVADDDGQDRGGRTAGAANAGTRTEDDASVARTPASLPSIPSDTVLRVELLNRLSTDVSQRGDRFEARVIEPREYEGAVVAGRVAEVGRAGKVKGRARLQLDFDQIRLTDGDWTDFHAQVIEVVPMGGDEEIGEVDPEGGVHGKSTTKDDVAKVGAASGVGAIIGAITGGGKGAAIGAIIGAGAGTGGVMTQRGKDLRFERGQQLRIRTSGTR